MLKYNNYDLLMNPELCDIIDSTLDDIGDIDPIKAAWLAYWICDDYYRRI